ncbi:helix-turn-helix domain-containing protein [Umezawaea endophytica]|uniref:Helix-turn-helix domain containing protein n=1 Tax=Umezawaea endophytica TaxID=1654476 RepID=A0A9X2VWB5_9PSEU|nr:helix-turn-helix domain containing protein [Umezawaea endophytica]MCS7483806.1 helix-turn-helix domain containing protein [Umezawaea endophytica]
MSEPPRIHNEIHGVVFGDVVQIRQLVVPMTPSGPPWMASPLDRIVERPEEWIAWDVPAAETARRPRVSTNAVYVWRRRWRAEGMAALASRGRADRPVAWTTPAWIG